MSYSPQAPATGFACFDLDPRVRRGIAAVGFESPRPIQLQTIPAALAGRDILGLAPTGTGKTAAFAIPILERLLASAGEGPQVLVVVPTRELASQIGAEVRRLGSELSIEVTTLFGGVPVKRQVAALRRQPAIVVACPGRLLDLWRQGAVSLAGITTLVLDEADHMFDMGFLPDLRRILAALPARRQNLLFSATMPEAIRGLAHEVLRDPHIVELQHSRPVATVAHALLPVDRTRKFAVLEEVLAEDGFASAIVFTRTKHRARKLAQQLDRAGHGAVALQGNMSQGQRERALAGFRSRRFQVLVATDLAARGLDVPEVSHVVNFDMPISAEAYTHRIGRTGRSERTGRAYTFVTPEDTDAVRAVERRLGTLPRQQVERVAASSRPRELPPARRGEGRGTRRRAGGRAARSA